MNRILDFSEELAYVTVEPGVTQAQPFAVLQERGFGHTPYGDHFDHSFGIEVVLPDGSVIDTGFARFTGAKAAPLHRAGLGPILDGLFSQSNLGVVTRMTIWLMPAPEDFEAYYFRCEKSEGLPAIVDALRPLRLDGTIRIASHIANDYKSDLRP
jgi:4-cresol dehydrogenase (hydroxylating)